MRHRDTFCSMIATQVSSRQISLDKGHLAVANYDLNIIKQRLKEAEEVIAFYADELIGSSCPASDCEHSKDGAWEYIGGKRARDYFSKYSEDK